MAEGGVFNTPPPTPPGSPRRTLGALGDVERPAGGAGSSSAGAAAALAASNRCANCPSKSMLMGWSSRCIKPCKPWSALVLRSLKALLALERNGSIHAIDATKRFYSLLMMALCNTGVTNTALSLGTFGQRHDYSSVANILTMLPCQPTLAATTILASLLAH